MSSREDWQKQATTHVNNVSIARHLSIKFISQTTEDGVPTARTEFVSNPRHLVPSNSVHGGISALLIDSACFLAAIQILDAGQGAVTVASSFQNLNSVLGEGNKHEVVGRVVRRGKGLLFCEGEIMCQGKLITKGILTKTITQMIPQEKKEKDQRSKL